MVRLNLTWPALGPYLPYSPGVGTIGSAGVDDVALAAADQNR